METGNVDVVAIGSSAGGIEALTTILSALPIYFPAAIVLVQHRSPIAANLLEQVLSHRTRLAVKTAADGDRPCAGTVYVAPGGKHLLVGPQSTLILSEGEKVRFAKPSVDVLFASIAANYQCRAKLGVILTGMASDGAAGVAAMKRAGATIIVQNEKTCFAFGMPQAAISTGYTDLVMPLDQIPRALIAFTMIHQSAQLFKTPIPVYN